MPSMEQKIIAAKLEERLAKKQDTEQGHLYFEKAYEEMQESWENTFNRPIQSSVPVLAPLVVIFKKILRRVTAWYANPFADQQRVFNYATVKTARYTENNLENLRRENRELLARVERLEERLNDLADTGTPGGHHG